MKSSNKADVSGDLIQVGRVVGAHGIGGALKVYSYAESAECFAPRRELVLVGRRGSPAQFCITWSQAHKKVMRLMLEGVSGREQAEALIGADVYIYKKDLPPLEPDTFYWQDVIGMQVFTTAGEHLGELTQIIPTGANDVYVIEPAAHNATGEILIPAIASVVIEIDVAARRMRVELPEGLV